MRDLMISMEDNEVKSYETAYYCNWEESTINQIPEEAFHYSRGRLFDACTCIISCGPFLTGFTLQ